MAAVKDIKTWVSHHDLSVSILLIIAPSTDFHPHLYESWQCGMMVDG
jgi:hypothetical protein